MSHLTQADEALQAGQLDEARRLSQTCLTLAISRHAPELEASARMQLARCLSAQGDMRGALAHCRHGIAIFEAANDPRGEMRTLAVAAYAATNLRERDQAMAFAGRAVALGKEIADTSLRAMAHNYLGVAQFWAGDAERADESFGFATRLARLTGLAHAEVVPVQNHAAGEIATSLVSRVLNDRECDPARLTEIVAGLRGADLRKASVFMSVRQRTESEAVMACLDSIGASWGGHLARGREFARTAADAVSSSTPNPTWVVPYVALAHHEIAHAGRDFHGAVRHCLALEESALNGQNLQMAWLGKALRLRALEALGSDRSASRGWRELLGGEMALRHGCVDGAAGGNAVARRQEIIDSWRSRFELTGSESAILELLGGGHPVAAIARARGTAVGTVRNQLSIVFDKTGLRSQQALLAALLQAVDDGT